MRKVGLPAVTERMLVEKYKMTLSGIRLRKLFVLAGQNTTFGG
jgi:hypothetical protein